MNFTEVGLIFFLNKSCILFPIYCLKFDFSQRYDIINTILNPPKLNYVSVHWCLSAVKFISSVILSWSQLKYR